MDINILLGLQEFRNGAGAFLADFLLKMTYFGELNTVLVIMAVIYWCVSKDVGTYLLMGWSGNRILNGALKVTVCAYRPWIRDARILPYGDSINTATGYSFASGQTMNAATVFGGGAVRKDLPGMLRAALGVMVVLVAFSRIYLGVHTAGYSCRRCLRNACHVSDSETYAMGKSPSGKRPSDRIYRHRPCNLCGSLCRCEAVP